MALTSNAGRVLEGTQGSDTHRSNTLTTPHARVAESTFAGHRVKYKILKYNMEKYNSSPFFILLLIQSALTCLLILILKVYARMFIHSFANFHNRFWNARTRTIALKISQEQRTTNTS